MVQKSAQIMQLDLICTKIFMKMRLNTYLYAPKNRPIRNQPMFVCFRPMLLLNQSLFVCVCKNIKMTILAFLVGKLPTNY